MDQQLSLPMGSTEATEWAAWEPLKGPIAKPPSGPIGATINGNHISHHVGKT